MKPFAFLICMVGMWSSSEAAPPNRQDVPVSASKFTADLQYVTFPFHVTTKGINPNPIGSDGDSIPQLVALAPKVKTVFAALNAPVFDVAKTLHEFGLSLPRGSVALYSPSSKLLFVELTADDMEIVEILIRPHPPMGNSVNTLELRVSTQSKGKEPQSVFETKSLTIRNGATTELHLRGDTVLDLTLQPIIGPDDQTIDLDIKGTVARQAKSTAFNTSWLTSISKPASITLGNVDDTSVKIDFELNEVIEWTGPQALRTPTQKAAAIKSIKADLSR